jgi:hypothetical protein
VASGKLTRREVDEVLRRAAELESRRLGKGAGAGEDDEGDPQGTHLPEPDVFRLGQEAGLSEDALREALVDLRTGALGREGHPPSPWEIIVTRTVPGEPEPVARAVERFLRDQLMTIRRHHGARIEWQRARGLWPGLMRSLEFARRFAFGPVARVETHVEAAGDGGGTHVSFRIDLGPWRRDRLVRAVGRAATAFGCFGLGGAWLLPGFGLPDVMALLAGGGIAGGLVALEQRRFAHSREEVAVAPERFLDLLVLRRTKALARATHRQLASSGAAGAGDSKPTPEPEET